MSDFAHWNYIAANAGTELWPNLLYLYSRSGETRDLHMVEGSFEDPDYTPPEWALDTEQQAAEDYYYVRRGDYFHCVNGNPIPLTSRPDNVWVYHEDGKTLVGRRSGDIATGKILLIIEPYYIRPLF
jgi:hypothetical protein